MFGYCGNLGHPTDPENGLVYMRARFYEPWTGRFLSRDRLYEGRNPFSYCLNNPTSFVDPDGNASRTTYQVGDYFWHFDPDGPDLHIQKIKGGEVLSRMDGGAMKHPWRAENAAEVNQAVRQLTTQGLAGNDTALKVLKKIDKSKGYGVFTRVKRAGGFRALAVSGGLGYTTLDAYAQQQPEDFIDTLLTIAGGGR
jgi:RHS repeat-associated protein